MRTLFENKMSAERAEQLFGEDWIDYYRAIDYGYSG